MKKSFSEWFTAARLVIVGFMLVALAFGLTGCFGLIGGPTAEIEVISDSLDDGDGQVEFDLSGSKAASGKQISGYVFYPDEDDTDTKITEEDEPMADGGWDSIVQTMSKGVHNAELTVTQENGTVVTDSTKEKYDHKS